MVQRRNSLRFLLNQNRSNTNNTSNNHEYQKQIYFISLGLIYHQSEVLIYRQWRSAEIVGDLTAVKAVPYVREENSDNIVLGNRALHQPHAWPVVKESPLTNHLFKSPFDHLSHLGHHSVPECFWGAGDDISEATKEMQ